MRFTIPALLTLAIACEPTQQIDQFQPDQLEAPLATNDQVEESMEESEASGVASISGADRDWTLALEDESAAVSTLTIHVPGGSDLSLYDGVALSISLGNAWGDDTRTVALSDEAGLAFIVQPDLGYGPAFDAFGSGLVDYGDEIATGTVSDDYGQYEVSYRMARFQTDEGAIDALPGEPFEALLDGTTWRIVVHASFEVTESPDTMPGCGGGTSSTLSFEMQRVEAASLEPRSRAPGAGMAGQHHCE